MMNQEEMMLKRKIDSDGYFIEDVYTSEISDDLIEIEVPSGQLKPRWNGSEWIDEEAHIAKQLLAELPMKYLRFERTRLLTETDWEVTRGIEEGIDITELKTYRSALRNLPQEIEAGNIEAPTLDENAELVFNSWPVRG